MITNKEELLQAMGKGKALHIAKDKTHAMCMMSSIYIRTPIDFPEQVDIDLALNLVFNSNDLCQAEEEDVRQKIGWKNAGLPGYCYDIWRFIQ